MMLNEKPCILYSGKNDSVRPQRTPAACHPEYMQNKDHRSIALCQRFVPGLIHFAYGSFRMKGCGGRESGGLWRAFGIWGTLAKKLEMTRDGGNWGFPGSCYASAACWVMSCHKKAQVASAQLYWVMYSP